MFGRTEVMKFNLYSGNGSPRNGECLETSRVLQTTRASKGQATIYTSLQRWNEQGVKSISECGGVGKQRQTYTEGGGSEDTGRRWPCDQRAASLSHGTVRNCQQTPEPGRQGGLLSEGAWPYGHLDFGLGASSVHHNNFLLHQAAQCLVSCYDSPRKLTGPAYT